jgi:hypothetical protein
VPRRSTERRSTAILATTRRSLGWPRSHGRAAIPAIAAYETLLKQNPGYVPALAALADLKWQTGAKGEARALYRQVIDAAPGSSYAEHARARLGSSESTSEPKSAPTPTSPATAPPSAPPSAPATTTAPETQELPPGVDVSDLPDLH